MKDQIAKIICQEERNCGDCDITLDRCERYKPKKYCDVVEKCANRIIALIEQPTKCSVLGCPNEASYYIPAECFEIRVRCAVCLGHLPTYFNIAQQLEKLETVV